MYAKLFSGDIMNELFIKQMQELLKDEFNDFAKALMQKQVKALYLNKTKENVDQLINQFELKPHHLVKDGYYYDYEKYLLGKHPYHDAGLYYIQEPSAMIVASLLDLKEGDKVLDMCSAPGGKAGYVASHLNQTGLVVANDINPLRASILSGNMERLGLTNTLVTNCEPKKITQQCKEFFDKVILDAPCSGEGMFRKLEQAIETWSIDKVKECASIQKELIDEAYEALKPGGELIYSTCTYNLEENEKVVEYVLNLHSDLELIPISLQAGMSPGIGYPECCRLYPHKHLGEGQFIALFKKQGTPTPKKYKILKSNVTGEQKKLLQQFYKENLNIPMPKQVINSNNHLYAIGKDFPELKKIKILRTGLYLGECKKNRFEPSYSLSHTLTKKDVKRYYDYPSSSQEIANYLKGETLPGNQEKGYGILFVDGYALAFYKESNNTVKNLFPKGLRKHY